MFYAVFGEVLAYGFEYCWHFCRIVGRNCGSDGLRLCVPVLFVMYTLPQYSPITISVSVTISS